MEFISELKPNSLGRDHFRVIITPLLINFLYYALLYFQTFIKERDDENALGYVFYFRIYGYSPFAPSYFATSSLSAFITLFLAIWIGIKTINLNGNLGNVGISSLIIGIIYFLLDDVFFVLFINEDLANNVQADYTITEFIRENIEFLSARLVYGLVEFVIVSIIFAGLYLELTKNIGLDRLTEEEKLYPKS